jgi:hypothetical protein
MPDGIGYRPVNHKASGRGMINLLRRKNMQFIFDFQPFSGVTLTNNQQKQKVT